MNSPKHVAIIMDGNGRWGLKKKKNRNLGHKAGLQTVETIIKSSIKNNIEYLTLYAFSTENWKRPNLEIKFLLNLLETFLKDKIDELYENGIKFKIIGDIKKFPKKIQENLKSAEKATTNNKKLQLILALNYGSKSELVNALKIIKSKKMKINENSITNSLYTKGIPNPDLLIRTGDTNRLSNFLLWQLSYSEIFFVKKLWPDFNKKDFFKILRNYKKIKRKFGSI